MMDIKGPEIRTRVVEKPIVLEVGQLFDFIVSLDVPMS
jgi:pyruvate kinase